MIYELSNETFELLVKIDSIFMLSIFAIVTILLASVLCHYLRTLIYIFENKKMGELKKNEFYKMGLVKSEEDKKDV